MKLHTQTGWHNTSREVAAPLTPVLSGVHPTQLALVELLDGLAICHRKIVLLLLGRRTTLRYFLGVRQQAVGKAHCSCSRIHQSQRLREALLRTCRSRCIVCFRPSTSAFLGTAGCTTNRRLSTRDYLTALGRAGTGRQSLSRIATPYLVSGCTRCFS